MRRALSVQNETRCAGAPPFRHLRPRPRIWQAGPALQALGLLMADLIRADRTATASSARRQVRGRDRPLAGLSALPGPAGHGPSSWPPTASSRAAKSARCGFRAARHDPMHRACVRREINLLGAAGPHAAPHRGQWPHGEEVLCIGQSLAAAGGSAAPAHRHPAGHGARLRPASGASRRATACCSSWPARPCSSSTRRPAAR